MPVPCGGQCLESWQCSKAKVVVSETLCLAVDVCTCLWVFVKPMPLARFPSTLSLPGTGSQSSSCSVSPGSSHHSSCTCNRLSGGISLPKALPSLVSTEVLFLKLVLLHNHQPSECTCNFIVASRLSGSTGCAVVNGSAQIPPPGELSECLQRRLATGTCDVAGPPAFLPRADGLCVGGRQQSGLCAPGGGASHQEMGCSQPCCCRCYSSDSSGLD